MSEVASRELITQGSSAGFILLEVPRAERLRQDLGHRLNTLRRHDFQVWSTVLIEQLAAAPARHQRMSELASADTNGRERGGQRHSPEYWQDR